MTFRLLVSGLLATAAAQGLSAAPAAPRVVTSHRRRTEKAMSASRKAAGLLLAALTAVGMSATPAAGDPQNGFAVPNTCDDGHTYTTIAQAGQEWNAQLDTTSTSVFHLTWYEITYVITTPDGTTTTFGPFESVKGGNDREQKNLLTCTFAFDIYGADGTQRHHVGLARGWLTPSSA